MNKKILFTALLIQLSTVFSLKAADYTYLGLVGDATVVGWVPQGIPMVQFSINNKLFTYAGVLKPGRLKIHAENGDWCDGDWIMPSTNGQSINNIAHIISTGCAVDNTWEITGADEGIYTITIDVENMTINFTKVNHYPNLYLIGSATPGGWVLDNASGLTVDAGNPALFTWTGNLIEGNFKISTNLTYAENYHWIHPLTQGQSLNETNAALVISLSGGQDNQWAISAADEGTYTVTVNLSGANPTVEIVKTGSLPLNFLSFSAKLDNTLASQVILNWKTTNEVNTQSFGIERSINGKVFETIGNEPAKNISGINNYIFKDENALEGTSYYRLKCKPSKKSDCYKSEKS